MHRDHYVIFAGVVNTTMKQIKKIAALLLCLSAGTANAQATLNIEPKEKPKPTFIFKELGYTSDGIYALGIDDKSEKSDYYLEKYDPSSLGLVYQKPLNICEDDKQALVHPLLVPPVCIKTGEQFLVFYNSFDEASKNVSINLKIAKASGDVSSKHTVLLSSKDIDVQMEGFYWSSSENQKQVISYYPSVDLSSIVIDIESPKYRKILVYKMADLLAGSNTHTETDIKNLITNEKMMTDKCFLVNGKLIFSYFKSLPAGGTDFGFAVLDNAANAFNLVSSGIKANDVFSMDYCVNASSNKIFMTGFLRISKSTAKKMNLEDCKVKNFNSFFDLNSSSFSQAIQNEFTPAIAKVISTPNTYGIIPKDQTPDNYLENVTILETPGNYFRISQLMLGREPGPAINMAALGGSAQGGGGVTTVARDILVQQYDKTGKLSGEFLLPKQNGFNTFAGTKSGALRTFANRQRNFSYYISNNDLHFFYPDNKKNVLYPIESYDPREIRNSEAGSSMAHLSLKNGKVEKELFDTGKSICIFYSDQNITFPGGVILEVESGKGSVLGKVTVK